MTNNRDLIERFDRWAAQPNTGSINQQRRMAEFATELRNALEAADRAQRENDGSVHAAVIFALGDRALMSDDEPNLAASAAQWVEDEPDEFWELYAGPMLDAMEAQFS